MSLKQVICVRKDLNMRKGKMVAQGSHASLMSYTNSLTPKNYSIAGEWLNDGQTKICVGVDSEQQLRDIYAEARLAGLPCSLVLDAGHTEFKEPTYTACAIGPADSDEIDKITGALKLL